jgi:phd_YefM
MEIQYLTDARGKKNAIVLPIKMYEKMIEDMEDMEDLLAVLQRKNSRASPFSEALERIKKYREKNLNTESR